MKSLVIVAPHPDDEVIGCQLALGATGTIIYMDDSSEERNNEARRLCDLYSIQPEFGQEGMDLWLQRQDDSGRASPYTFLFPDPHFETHPFHREVGQMGERLLRRCGWKVQFYSTNMAAPYVFEHPYPTDKRKLLDKYYPSQAGMWAADYRYFLFEGRVTWHNVRIPE